MQEKFMSTPLAKLNPLLKQPPSKFRSVFGFFSPEHWRMKSIDQTLRYLDNPSQLYNVKNQARKNLSEWEARSSPFPEQVEVRAEDWGTAAQSATAQHGAIYPVLNNASAKFPGGRFLDYGSAQEEDLFHRSTLPLTLSLPGVHFDAKKGFFIYDEPTSNLINAETTMSSEELELLSRIYCKAISHAYKVFFNKDPQTCFRGPEVLIEPTDPEIRFGSKPKLSVESTLSFLFSSKKEIFPFYDFRSAAPDLSALNIDWRNEAFVSAYQKDLARRIGAQLDTLILHNTPRAILGALGCGCYKNPPELVAEVYRQEIHKRAAFFEHLVFAIKMTSYDESHNFSVFREKLQGLPLGKKALASDISRKSRESSYLCP